MYAYVEYDDGDAAPFTAYVESLTFGSFAFTKDYEVFNALAWGRECLSSPGDRDPTRFPKFPPRGMPNPISLSVARDFYRIVAAPADLPDRYFWPHHGCVTPETAEQWLRDGSVEGEVFQWFNCPSGGLRWRVVSRHGAFNASWLTPREFDEALVHHGLELEELPPVYRILRQAMATLGMDLGSENRVRLVLWFD